MNPESIARTHPILFAILIAVAYVVIFGWMSIVHVVAASLLFALWLVIVLNEDDDDTDMFLGGPRAA